MESTGAWLEKALLDLCKKVETGLDLDKDIISGLVSYCELADPVDAKEYLDNIIGEQTGKVIIDEYMRRRGYSHPGSGRSVGSQDSGLQAYVKPPSMDVSSSGGSKKPSRASRGDSVSINPQNQGFPGKIEPVPPNPSSKSQNQSSSKKKKSGKVISLADAAKGSIVFQQGKPCSCQARQHRLVSNCLSCGKIVCEQEGEGPCSFCGALVLKEGSQYAGLDESLPVLTKSEAAAEAYAKRLVEYDRNSAARTTVIDDQSDYYEIEGNSWLSKEEKELLLTKKEEIEEAERAQRNKVVVTFDLVGRKVLFNQDEGPESAPGSSGILRPPEESGVNRIKPSPNLKLQPIFIDPGPGPTRKPDGRSKAPSSSPFKSGRMCLEITGRVQHDNDELKHLIAENRSDNEKPWRGPSVSGASAQAEETECY